jgi:hypothetical protein
MKKVKNGQKKTYENMSVHLFGFISLLKTYRFGSSMAQIKGHVPQLIVLKSATNLYLIYTRKNHMPKSEKTRFSKVSVFKINLILW